MVYVRESDIRARSRILAKASSIRILAEAQKSAKGKRVFLSHSNLDKVLLADIVEILGTHGASAYVDADDDELPKTPSRQTAAVLRERICECPRFILVATQNIRHSRWAPWELGFADGVQGPSNVALFPVVLDQSASASSVSVEQEYLDTYPRVEEAMTLSGPEYRVRDPRDGKYWRLGHWLLHSIT